MSELAYLRLLRQLARAERGPARRNVATASEPSARSPSPRPETRAPVDEAGIVPRAFFVPARVEVRRRRPEVPWRVRFEKWVARSVARRRDWALLAYDLETAGLDPEEADRRAFLALEGIA